MSDNSTLTSEQSKIVRELQEAVRDFGKSSVFLPDALRDNHRAVAEKFRELEAAFPEAAKVAAEYYKDELPDEPEELEGYGDALFSLLLDLQGFYDAESFAAVASSFESLHDSIYSLATFSDEYNVDRGMWEAEIAIHEESFRVAMAKLDK